LKAVTLAGFVRFWIRKSGSSFKHDVNF
jgi:hypothetical protein